MNLRAVPDEQNPDWASFTNNIPNRYARCRGTNHWWDAYTVTELKSPRKRTVGYEVTEKCDRCGATRSRMLDSGGYVTKNGKRTYPDGYLATGIHGVGVADRKAAMRLRVMLDATIPAAKRKRK